MLFSACDVEGYVASFPGVGTRRAWDIVPRVREEVLAGCGIEAGLVWLIDEFRPEGQHRELWARVEELLPADFLEHLRGDRDRARKLLAKRAPRELALAGFLPSDLGYAFGREWREGRIGWGEGLQRLAGLVGERRRRLLELLERGRDQGERGVAEAASLSAGVPDTELFQVEAILDKRLRRGRYGYLIKWRHFGHCWDSW
ncbi:MAG: chromo domain-containing protein, partial [archaeon]|nr:chromo domain-containing protein [archaeon]